MAYSSGVTIKVEPNRFQVTDQKAASNLAESKAVEITRRYIGVLPHVRYTGVGTNFRNFVAMEQPDAFLRERFLRPGPWNNERTPLHAVNLKFVYPHDGGQLTLSMEGGTLVRQEGEELTQTPGVLTHANFHRDCGGYPTDRLVVSHIEKFLDDEAHIRSLLEELLFGTVA